LKSNVLGKPLAWDLADELGLDPAIRLVGLQREPPSVAERHADNAQAECGKNLATADREFDRFLIVSSARSSSTLGQATVLNPNAVSELSCVHFQCSFGAVAT
jgi:hypothetical protein